MKRYSHFGWMELIIGVLLVLLGLFTLLRPGSVLTWLILFYGLLAMFTGVSDIIFYVKTERHMGFGPTISLVSGILSILSGLMLFLYPGVGKWAMAIFFPMWFIAHCISRLSHLNFVRGLAGTGYYMVALVINVIGLLCGCLMLLFPGFSLVTMNYIIGIYLILLGIDSIVLACSKAGTRW